MSCGGGTLPPGGGFQTAQGSVYSFIGDAPPAGSTVLKFEITLSSATLCPTVGAGGECTGSPQVSLLSAPVKIEMTQLQLQSAFLSLKTAEAGSYAGVRLVFSNPELKLLIPDGTIQELEGAALPLSPSAVTATFSPTLMVGDDTNTGFLIDFNAQDSIQSSGGVVTGISPVVTLVPKVFSATQPAEEIEDATGSLSNVSTTCATTSGTFTFTDLITGLPTSGVRFDATTEFDDGASCDTLANGQIVEVDLELRSPDAATAFFFARKIELVNEADEEGLEGTILGVNSATQFVLLVHHGSVSTGFASGDVVTVSFDPQNVQFRVESNEFSNLPSFATGADLLAGQKVEVDVVSSAAGAGGCAAESDNCTATVDKVKLKKSTYTAQVGQAIVNPDFAFNQLPSLFGMQLPQSLRPLSSDCQSCLIETLTVRTGSATEYEDLPGGFSGLQTGQTVTVRGLLFKDGFAGPNPGFGTPLFMAQEIRLVTAAAQ